MSGYAYSDGYSSYGYEGYGSYGYGGGYRSYPNAALYLNGPGSSYHIGRTYSSSYAYENQNGGIYTHTIAQTSGGYIDETSYRLSNGSYKLTQSTFYENFLYKSGPTYGYGASVGYYSSYAPPSAYTENTFSLKQTYAGQTTHYDETGSSSTATTTGYIYSSYTHQTSEAIDGHPVTGAGYAYVLSSVTDPYGYTTYSSHTSTF